MSSDENKTVVRRVFEEIFNQNNLATVDELIAADYVYHRPGGPEMRGPATYKRLLGTFRMAFPDVQFTIQEMIAEGDAVFTRWRFSATHQGEFMGIAPTGNRILSDGMLLSRCAGGMLVEEVELMDELGILRQLGATVHPAQMPAAAT
jgi:predicted ester cyclase